MTPAGSKARRATTPRFPATMQKNERLLPTMPNTDEQTPSPKRANAFDIRTGMAVFGADGQKLGTVMDIAGFGSTKIQSVDEHGTSELVTQAKTVGGYFNLDRREVEGIRAAPPLCVPFHGIQDVVPGRGVLLNDTI